MDRLRDGRNEKNKLVSVLIHLCILHRRIHKHNHNQSCLKIPSDSICSTTEVYTLEPQGVNIPKDIEFHGCTIIRWMPFRTGKCEMAREFTIFS